MRSHKQGTRGTAVRVRPISPLIGALHTTENRVQTCRVRPSSACRGTGPPASACSSGTWRARGGQRATRHPNPNPNHAAAALGARAAVNAPPGGPGSPWCGAPSEARRLYSQ
jgi:hypothetical protein